MKFHFEFDIKKLPWPISHSHNLFLTGSCFTENIGEKLKRNKFRVMENPHGILFNPISVSEAIVDYIDKKQYNASDLFELNEGWHSWKHHSRYSKISSAEAVEKINSSINLAHDFLKKSDYVIITLGSAWVYTLSEFASNALLGSVAANNHKAPANWFNKKLLTPEEVLSALDNVMHRLFHFSPGIKIIFTISPVRHLREGVVENNRSKSVLIQAVHHLVNKFEGLYYFPAYELVIDDLRDYRFYAEDMVHPNYAATEYVWEKFQLACMEDSTRKLMEEIGSINLAFKHRPFNPYSGNHKKFLQATLDKTQRLQEQYPELDFTAEIEKFQDGLQ